MALRILGLEARRRTDGGRSTDVDLASLLSHELRTPLGHIRAFASTLLQPDVRWDETTRQEYVRDIEQEAIRLERLIDDVLDISRIQAGLADPLVRPVAVDAVISAAAKSMHGPLEGRELLIDLAPDLPPALLDLPLMARVLCNLLDNASKYSPAGTPIRVSASRHAGEVWIAVEDHGPGIPRDEAGRIFEKFVRLHAPGAPPVPGTGLGLAICRGIVEAHGGRIWAEDRRGGGARLVVALRAADGGRGHASP